MVLEGGVWYWIYCIIYLLFVCKGLVMKDLCVCGRVSEWECAKCEEVGYCSETCQEEDWPNHKSFCRDIRRKRKEMKRRLKEEQKRSLALRSLDTVSSLSHHILHVHWHREF